jgi:hypothetical protein
MEVRHISRGALHTTSFGKVAFGLNWSSEMSGGDDRNLCAEELATLEWLIAEAVGSLEGMLSDEASKGCETRSSSDDALMCL